MSEPRTDHNELRLMILLERYWSLFVEDLIVFWIRVDNVAQRYGIDFFVDGFHIVHSLWLTLPRSAYFLATFYTQVALEDMRSSAPLRRIWLVRVLNVPNFHCVICCPIRDGRCPKVIQWPQCTIHTESYSGCIVKLWGLTTSRWTSDLRPWTNLSKHSTANMSLIVSIQFRNSVIYFWDRCRLLKSTESVTSPSDMVLRTKSSHHHHSKCLPRIWGLFLLN